MASPNKKQMFKILVLGHSGVGKTSIVQRYANNVFKDRYTATVNVEFEIKEILVDDKRVSLQIWDTFGERMQELGNSYYRGVNCCVLVYDITNRESFENLDAWRNTFINRRGVQDPNSFPIVLLGNKTDKEDNRQVTAKEAQAWCDRNGHIQYFEVSAKENKGLDQAFQLAAKSTAAQHKEEDYVPETIKLKSRSSEKPVKSGCC